MHKVFIDGWMPQVPIFVHRGRDPFSQHQESRPLAAHNTRSPRFKDSLSNLRNLIGRTNTIRMLKNWEWPEVSILGADEKDRVQAQAEVKMPKYYNEFSNHCILEL